MVQPVSKGQSHHGTSDHCHDRHEELSGKTSPLSLKERLIIRLEHHMRHNHEHAELCTQLADAAVELGEEEAARQLRAAMACITSQNEHLEKALKLLRSPF